MVRSRSLLRAGLNLNTRKGLEQAIKESKSQRAALKERLARVNAGRYVSPVEGPSSESGEDEQPDSGNEESDSDDEEESGSGGKGKAGYGIWLRLWTMPRRTTILRPSLRRKRIAMMSLLLPSCKQNEDVVGSSSWGWRSAFCSLSVHVRDQRRIWGS